MALAVGKELALLLAVEQVGTGREFDGIGAEGLLHAGQIVGSLLGMNPFVQKEVGNVTQQQGAGVLGQLQAGQQVIGRMMAVLLETLRQRTDVYQIVGLEDEEGRRQHAGLVHRHVQQVELRVPPEQGTGLGKLLVDLGHAVAHLQQLVGHGVRGRNIKVLSVGILEADTHPADAFAGGRSHHVSGIGTGKPTVERGGYVPARQPLEEEGQRLDIAQQAVGQRSLLAVQYGVGRQAEGVQTVLLHNVQPQLGSHETDARREVGHLQCAVRHLRAAQVLQHLTQLAVSATQGRLPLLHAAYGLKQGVVFVYLINLHVCL